MEKQYNNAKSLGKRALKSKSFRRYLFVGVSTVAIDFILLVVLREKLSGGLFSAVTIAYWTAIFYNFLMNRHWSFEAQEGMIPKQMLQYGTLLLFNYSLTLLVVTSVESLGISEYIGKLLALGITIMWTYVIYRKVIFKT